MVRLLGLEPGQGFGQRRLEKGCLFFGDEVAGDEAERRCECCPLRLVADRKSVV